MIKLMGKISIRLVKKEVAGMSMIMPSKYIHTNKKNKVATAS